MRLRRATRRMPPGDGPVTGRDYRVRFSARDAQLGPAPCTEVRLPWPASVTSAAYCRLDRGVPVFGSAVGDYQRFWRDICSGCQLELEWSDSMAPQPPEVE